MVPGSSFADERIYGEWLETSSRAFVVASVGNLDLVPDVGGLAALLSTPIVCPRGEATGLAALDHRLC